MPFEPNPSPTQVLNRESDQADEAGAETKSTGAMMLEETRESARNCMAPTTPTGRRWRGRRTATRTEPRSLVRPRRAPRRTTQLDQERKRTRATAGREQRTTGGWTRPLAHPHIEMKKRRTNGNLEKRETEEMEKAFRPEETEEGDDEEEEGDREEDLEGDEDSDPFSSVMTGTRSFKPQSRERYPGEQEAEGDHDDPPKTASSGQAGEAEGRANEQQEATPTTMTTREQSLASLIVGQLSGCLQGIADTRSSTSGRSATEKCQLGSRRLPSSGRQ